MTMSQQNLCSQDRRLGDRKNAGSSCLSGVHLWKKLFHEFQERVHCCNRWNSRWALHLHRALKTLQNS